MKPERHSASIFCCAILLFTATVALALPKAPPKPKAGPGVSAPGRPAAPAPQSEAAALAVEGKAAVLAEVSSNTRLFEQNPDVLIEPASFTKVMTLYLVFEALRNGQVHLQDEIYISERAWKTGGSQMFIGVGSKIPLDDLIKGIAVVSGNDSCVAVAEHLAGSVETFVVLMNRKAQELGMSKSVFLNAHGLPAEGQVTTAGDMTTLALAYLKQFPEALNYHSMKEYTYNGITQHNRNRLLFKDDTVDGLKTGFIAASGYHLAATAKRDGMRLVAVVMGTPKPSVREREALKLLNYGFRRYALVNPFPIDQPAATVKVWKGQKDHLELYPEENSNVLIEQSAKNSVRSIIDAPKEITAPVQAHRPVGAITIYVGENLKKTISLASHENVAQAGLMTRFWHSLLRIHTLNWSLIGMVTLGIVALLILGVFAAKFYNRFRLHNQRRSKHY